MAYRTVLDTLFHALVRYAAPVLVFTAEEVWTSRYPDSGSVHLLEWPALPRVDADATRWSALRRLRERVLEAIGIEEHFEHLHDIHAAELRPKPDRHGYELLCARFAIDPAHACMVEDMAQNLRPAKALGMTTVWVDNGSERGSHGYDEAIVDVRVTDVGEWLGSILGDDDG